MAIQKKKSVPLSLQVLPDWLAYRHLGKLVTLFQSMSWHGKTAGPCAATVSGEARGSCPPRLVVHGSGGRQRQLNSIPEPTTTASITPGTSASLPLLTSSMEG